jgi:relaxase-like protein
MINVQSNGKHFDWLVAYLLRTERDPERVAWTATRNLPTEDPELAAVFMRATAAQSTFVQKPVYQIVLSFAPEDPADRVMMERVANRVLQRLGLREHQALLVAHQDRPHPHLHIIVNRVHPETGRVWALWQDWRRVRQVLQEEERALGLRPVSSRLLFVDAVAHDLRSHERVVELGHEQYRAELDASAAQARWRQLEHAAERARRARARSDQALAQVFRNPGEAYAAYAAAVNREGVTHATRRVREGPEQFGAVLTVQRPGPFGLGRTVDAGPARAAAPAAARAAAEALAAVREWQQTADAAAQRLEQVFDRELDALYQEPRAARARFERLAMERGAEQAGAALRELPAELGIVRPSVREDGNRFQAQVARAAACGIEAVQARAAAAEALGRSPRIPETPAVGRGEADRAAAWARALRDELRALPERVELERRLGAALDRLAPRELRLLRQALTAPQYALAMQIRRGIRDLVLDRDDDPEE